MLGIVHFCVPLYSYVCVRVMQPYDIYMMLVLVAFSHPLSLFCPNGQPYTLPWCIVHCEYKTVVVRTLDAFT